MILFNQLQAVNSTGHNFPKGISPKVKVKARLNFKLASYNIVVPYAVAYHLLQLKEQQI